MAQSDQPESATGAQSTSGAAGRQNRDDRGNSGRGQKRKFEGKQENGNKPIRQGKRHKGGDMGRGDYFRNQPDKRARNAELQAQRQQKQNENGEAPSSHLPPAFSKDEITAEDRKPKRKVAVMIGYSGTGYKGMQINHQERTIEGELFSAFVKAGAISKANADDPKKSGLVRCARTDKGVHAAGNMISLKLIVEEEDIVERINKELSPQIRIWGIERTTGSFSCYQACDSRWYEYLIPSHCFLPPHPDSFLGKKCVELAEAEGDLTSYEDRQTEVMDYWSKVDDEKIKPILEKLEPKLRALVSKALYESDAGPEAPEDGGEDKEAVGAADIVHAEEPASTSADGKEAANGPDELNEVTKRSLSGTTLVERAIEGNASSEEVIDKKALDQAIKTLKHAYIEAKRQWRISPTRLERIKDALAQYLGTKNYHNFTIQKTFRDPSAKRLIKSFKVNETPILINGTEWLSLKVHGQSFMMHQIRKMVGMAALVVRCGCPVSRIADALGPTDISIPKAPGLGLLLERPVFDNYNTSQAAKFGRESLDFSKYEKTMLEFKQREIYDRIYREEDESHQFHTFFAHLDNYKEPFFLYLTSAGLKAATGEEAQKAREKAIAQSKGEQQVKTRKAMELESDDETAVGAEDG